MLFTQLEHVRESTDLPLILMGYFNPVHMFGVGNFLRKCRDSGIDGTIIPDLPAEEYISSYKSLFEKYGIINIFLVTPQTPVDRVRYLDSFSEGFLYLVSSASTTGSINKIEPDQISYFEKIRALELTSPSMIGFGISNRETFRAACRHASGAIIGSAFISALDGEGTLKEKIGGFIRNING
jgi:tryptophan synthase alpha chain